MKTLFYLLLFAFVIGGINSQAQQTFYSNNFQSGATGWTTASAPTTCAGAPSGPSSWALATTCGGVPIALGSTAYGIANDGTLGAENSWIATPPITVTVPVIAIDFDSWTSNEAGFPCYYDVEIIEYTIDNGATWLPLHGYIPALHGVQQDETWRHFSFQATVPLNSTIRFRFRMDTGDDYSDLDSRGWYIDNVVVGGVFDFQATSTDITCEGSNNGSISFASVTGGVTPLSYSINGGTSFQSSSLFSNLTPGTYTLQVKDALNNITNTKSVSLQTTTVLSVNLTASGPTTFCSGNTVLLQAINNGYSVMKWRRNGVIIGDSNIISPSYHANQAGSYTIVVSKNGCSKESSPIAVSVNPQPAFQQYVNPTCTNSTNGSILISAPTVGTAPFQYSIDNGLTYYPNNLFANLPAGSYLTVVRDANNCLSLPVTTQVNSILDTSAPVVVGKNISVYLNQSGTATVNVTDVNNGSWDNCSIAGMQLSPNTFTSDNIGANTATLSAWDNNSNTSSVPVTITILSNPPPVAITKNISVYLNNAGQATISANQVDNGSTNTVSMSVTPTAFDCSNFGANTVVLTVKNANGDSSSAIAVVTVLDNIAPTAIAKNITLNLSALGTVSILATQLDNGSNDACGIANISVSPSAFSINNIGDNTVTLTVTDNHNNSATTTAIVTIVDITPPTVVTQNIQASLGANGSVTVSPTSINNGSFDLGGIASMSVSPNTFTCSNTGNNTVTLTVTDASGNSSSAPAVIVIRDTIKPTVTTQNIAVSPDALGNIAITASLVNNGSFDACGIASMTVSPNTFTCANTGANLVTLTVTDINGNVSSNTATVTVLGTSIPSTESAAYIGANGVLAWTNIPSVTNGQSAPITNLLTSIISPVINVLSTGGNITSNGCDGLGVSGGNVSNGCNNTTGFKNKTLNKNQTIKFSAALASLGISKLIFSSTYTGRVLITGKRSGDKVVSFTKLMVANDLDTFDFTGSCSLKGICLVDEVEIGLADDKSNARNWSGRGDGHKKCYGNYHDGDDDTDDDDQDFDDGLTCSSNCGISIKNPIVFIRQKESCGLSTLSNLNDIGKQVAISSTLSTTASPVNNLGINTDGNFATGIPFTFNYAKRLIVGYDTKGRPAAWEVTNLCQVNSIRQGKDANKPQLPLGSNAGNYTFTVTGIDANGQYIYGSRKQISNQFITPIRWRVTEYYQHIWVMNYEVVSMGKTAEENIEESTSVSTQVDTEIRTLVYPNPSNGNFNVQLITPKEESVSLTIMDITGKTVYETTAQAHETILIGNELMAGVYLCVIHQGDFAKTLKITKVN